MPPPTLTELAAQIAAHAKVLTDYITANNLPAPSFDKDGPATFPIPLTDADMQASRIALIEASKTMYELAVGPTEAIAWSALSSKFEVAMLRAVNQYKIPEAVPLDGEASFASIAAATGLGEDITTRIIRYAATSRLFNEHRPGYVIHTAGSRVLLENKLLGAYLVPTTDDGFQAAAKLNEAIDKYGDSGKSTETAFNVAFDTSDNYFEFMARPDQEWRKVAFHNAMRYVTEEGSTAGGTHGADQLLKGAFDWESLGESVFVDIGGSFGHVCTTIARKHKNLRFIVQDLESVIIEGRKKIAASDPNIASRISFMEHDFMGPQPVLGAAIYFMRLILHDWSDKYCITILKNLLPALRKGSKIVVMDIVMGEPNTLPTVVEKLQRSLDFSMLNSVGGKERTKSDWVKLVENTDARLKVLNISTPEGSALGFIEIGLADEGVE